MITKQGNEKINKSITIIKKHELAEIIAFAENAKN